MNDRFNRILEQLCLEEYSCQEDYPAHHFSLRHRRNMKRLFASRYSVPTTEIKPKLCCRTVAIIVAAIFLALVAVSGAAYFIGSFIMKEQNDNTQLMAASISEAPETIKQTYTLDGLPDGYREIDSYSDDFESVIIYQFEDDFNSTITFTQLVKNVYDGRFNTEGYDFESIQVNDYDGLLIDWSTAEYICSEIIWDNGKYIFTLVGNLSKEDTVKLAESAKIVR